MKDESLHIKTVLKLIDLLRGSGNIELSRDAMVDFMKSRIPSATSNQIKSSIRELYRHDMIAINNNKRGYTYLIDNTKYDSAKSAISKMQKFPNDLKNVRQMISKYQVVDRKIMNSIFSVYSTVNIDRIIMKLRKSGCLHKMYGKKSRGRYVVQKDIDSSPFITDPVDALASLMENDYILCYNTALEFYGLSRYSMNYVIYIDALTLRKLNHLDKVTIKKVRRKRSDIGTTVVQRKSRIIKITDIERTIIDCIHKPKYAIGWENVLYALTKLEKIDSDKLIYYLKNIQIPSLFAKIGLITEHYQNEWDIDSSIFQKIRLFCPKTPNRFFPGTPGVLNKKWNLYVPDDLFFQ